jgi:hypothetical protein
MQNFTKFNKYKLLLKKEVFFMPKADIVPKETEKSARRELALLIYRGESLSKAAQIISKRYENEYTNPLPVGKLKKDWKKRGEWLLEVFEINKDNILEQVLTEQMYIKGQLYDLVEETHEVGEKRLILKDIKNLNKEYIELLVDMGIIDRQPDKLEISGADGGPLAISSLAKAAEDWSEEEQLEQPDKDEEEGDE